MVGTINKDFQVGSSSQQLKKHDEKLRPLQFVLCNKKKKSPLQLVQN
jgi:hypothetical protein